MKVSVALLCAVFLGCTGTPPDDGSSDPAGQVADAGRRAMGLGPLSDTTGFLAHARVAGPDGGFTTTVVSGPGGLVRMEQSTGFLAGVDAAGPWTLDPTTGVESELSAASLAMVRGHELHMWAAYPEALATSSRFLGEVPFDSTLALAVAHTLSTGHEMIAYYATQDTLPLGFEVTWLEPRVRVTLDDWLPGPGARLFRSAEFRQGDELFTYVYDRVEIGTPPDSVFERPEGSARTEVR